MAEHAKDILQGGGSSKWVGDKDPKSGDAVAITDPQQFARQGQDHKEYKKKIRQERFGYKTHPGPISEVLAGITYGDACRTQHCIGHTDSQGDSMNCDCNILLEV
ncbi:uncharacterized protein [Apostichopus japonicus]|uniref:uncharacterized protein isoform X3 n=1 Tax=Stichopus japonicus TaxID=307972 RepID=UPI003AB53EC4